MSSNSFYSLEINCCSVKHLDNASCFDVWFKAPWLILTICKRDVRYRRRCSGYGRAHIHIKNAACLTPIIAVHRLMAAMRVCSQILWVTIALFLPAAFPCRSMICKDHVNQPTTAAPEHTW